VDVVKRRIAVDDLDRLADLHAEDVRHIAAAFLIEHHGRGGDREPEIPEPVLHVNEHVFQSTVAVDDDRLRDGGALLVAVRIRAHLDRGGLRRCPLEQDSPRDIAGSGRIDRVGEGRRSGGGGVLLRAAAAA
jgi:hypothetical protein